MNPQLGTKKTDSQIISTYYYFGSKKGDFKMKTKEKKPNLSKEWVELVKEAMESNITKEQFKIFLQKEKEKRENNKA
jgi:hypothetical protein